MQESELKAIGARIKTLRESVSVSAAQMCKDAGINAKTLSLFENGHRAPSQKFLTFLATKYRANQEWITTGRGDMISNQVVDEKYVHNLYTKIVGIEKELEDMRIMMEQLIKVLQKPSV